MADLNDRLRERAERAERERDEARAERDGIHAVGVSCEAKAAEHFRRELAAAEERAERERDAAEARGYRRGLEAAAVRLEARATSEEITAERRAQEDGEHAPSVVRQIAVAMTLRDEAARIRCAAVEPSPRPVQVGDRVRVVRCCAEDTFCCGSMVGSVGTLIAIDRECDRVPYEVDLTGDGGVQWFAAVERVEPSVRVLDETDGRPA